MGVSYSAVGHESNVNESAVYINKVSFNRNAHKTKFCIDGLMKMWWPEAHRNLPAYFLRSSGSVFAPSVFGWLGRALSNENQPSFPQGSALWLEYAQCGPAVLTILAL